MTGSHRMSSVRLLGHVSHLCSNVAQEEESDSSDKAGDLCYPEGLFPAMVLGNGAEWESRQEATNYNGNSHGLFQWKERNTHTKPNFRI